jgi:hypothetical protein
MAKWWSSFPPSPLIAQIWKLKLDQLRIKLKGWNANINRSLKDKKKNHLYLSIHHFELLLELLY